MGEESRVLGSETQLSAPRLRETKILHKHREIKILKLRCCEVFKVLFCIGFWGREKISEIWGNRTNHYHESGWRRARKKNKKI